MNPYSIAYLFFRLAPFIVVCSFVLQSFLALDLRGPVYAAGLVLSCLTTMMVSKMVPSSTTSPNTKCGLISIGESDQMASSMPLSMTVYGFTFWYLCVSVINQIMKAKSINTTNTQSKENSNSHTMSNILIQNAPIFIFFPIMAMSEYAWVSSNNCSCGQGCILGALFIGSLFGLLYGFFVRSVNPGLLYANYGTGVEVCSRPSKTYFRCTVKNNL